VVKTTHPARRSRMAQLKYWGELQDLFCLPAEKRARSGAISMARDPGDPATKKWEIALPLTGRLASVARQNRRQPAVLPVLSRNAPRTLARL